jgi:hypothetical protein
MPGKTNTKKWTAKQNLYQHTLIQETINKKNNIVVKILRTWSPHQATFGFIKKKAQD